MTCIGGRIDAQASCAERKPSYSNGVNSPLSTELISTQVYWYVPPCPFRGEEVGSAAALRDSCVAGNLVVGEDHPVGGENDTGCLDATRKSATSRQPAPMRAFLPELSKAQGGRPLRNVPIRAGECSTAANDPGPGDIYHHRFRAFSKDFPIICARWELRRPRIV